MIITESVMLCIKTHNLYDYYTAKGYIIPTQTHKNGTIKFYRDYRVEIKVSDLKENANCIVDVLCDYCGKKMSKTYNSYNIQRRNIQKDSCSDCQAQKIIDVSMSKYGVPNPSQVPEVIEKIKQSFQDKYGVDNIMHLPETFEKILNTTEERYGHKYILATEFGKNKVKETCLEKFGTETYFGSESFNDTMIERHGVKYMVMHPEKRDEIFDKILTTIDKRKGVRVSSQQIFIHEVIGGIINYLHNKSFLDIAFPESKIYVECDFSGHRLNTTMGDMSDQEFDRKELKRYYAIRNTGWKQIRIISTKDKMPQREVLLEMIRFGKEYLLTGRTYIEFNIDGGFVRTSQFNHEYDYGKLYVFKKQRGEIVF